MNQLADFFYFLHFRLDFAAARGLKVARSRAR
jgi:hypothetical protein